MINYLIEQVGKYPQMHDELIAQMCKQTNKNPDPKKTFRAWRIFSILVGVIPPSMKLLPTIVNYIVEKGPFLTHPISPPCGFLQPVNEPIYLLSPQSPC